MAFEYSLVYSWSIQGLLPKSISHGASKLWNGTLWSSWNISCCCQDSKLLSAKAIKYDSYPEENVNGREICHADGSIKLSSLSLLGKCCWLLASASAQMWIFESFSVVAHQSPLLSRGQRTFTSMLKLMPVSLSHILLKLNTFIMRKRSSTRFLGSGIVILVPESGGPPGIASQ